MRNVTSLSKSVLPPNKFTVLDTGIENENSVLGEASIGSGTRGDSALLATIATLLFEGTKPLPGRKKTWLGSRPKTLEAGGGQTSP